MGHYLSQTFYGNSITEWIISCCIIMASVLLAKFIYWFTSKTLKNLAQNSSSKLDDVLLDLIEKPIVFAVILFGFWYGINRLNFPSGIEKFFNHVFTLLITINITWLAARFFNALINEYVKPKIEKSESDLDDQLLPVLRKGVNIIIWTLGIIVGLNNAGYDVGALIAGLGIGGLALAMAAKDTVSNIFGGFTIFADKPFKIGDRVRMGGFDGTVEEIGIRSTRLRTLEGTLVTIPNANITGSMVENVSLEPSRKVEVKLNLPYDTNEQRMQEAITLLQNIAEQFKPDFIEEKVFTAFNSFGSSSLGISFVYHIKKEADILETQSKINLQILKQFNEQNLHFAFPTQTIQVVKEL